MSFTNQTTHYGLPQWIGSDKPTYLVDQNNAYQTIDSEIYNANVTAGEAVTTANGASSTAGAASATAADALSAAQTASTTADNALTAAQDAGTVAQAAQTAAGAAQTAAEAAQQAAAGNSITNLAPAYDSTITYAIDDLVTQDGKLYKCIVAVVTPEQFDINKWDDVTTSEVYAKRVNTSYYTILSYNNIKTVPADTSKTYSQFIEDALASLVTTLSNELLSNEEAIIKSIRFNYTDFVLETSNHITHYSTDFGNLQASSIANGSDYMDIELMYKYGTTPIDVVKTSIKHSDATVTYDNFSTATAPNTDFEIRYDIVKHVNG